MKKLRSTLALLLVLVMCLSLFPASAYAEDEGSLQVEQPAESVSNRPAYLSCGSFISNAEHRAYIDNAMSNHLSSNSGMISALNNGKSVIFMFEGGSDNYPGNSYSSSTRNQAVVIVVKKVNGAASIVFYSEDCSSIPDNPYHTDGSAYSNSARRLPKVFANSVRPRPLLSSNAYRRPSRLWATSTATPTSSTLSRQASCISLPSSAMMFSRSSRPS